MKKLFLAASGLFATVPGLTILWKGIGTPPGYIHLFGGLIEALGAISFITLWANQSKLKRIRPHRITRIAVLLCFGSFLSIVLYLGLFNFCVVGDPIRHTVYFPMWTSGEIAEMINASGSRYQTLQDNGFAAVYYKIRQMPYYPLAITVTTGLLLFLYQAIFTTLTTAFGVLGFHKGKRL